jgi:hypothetical protein
VKFNSTDLPSIGSGNLDTLYALPGTQLALGFPPVPDITVPQTFVVGAGGVVTYYNGTAFVSVGPLTVETRFNFNFIFKPNARGWQLTRLKADPVAGQSFYDVEQNWRNFYFFNRMHFFPSTAVIHGR